MSRRLFNSIGAAILLSHAALQAQQIEPLEPSLGKRPPPPNLVDSNAVAKHDSNVDRSPEVVVDLSGIDGEDGALGTSPRGESLSTTTNRPGVPLGNRAAADPLTSAIDWNSGATASWFRRLGLERWTRHPVIAAAISIGIVFLVYRSLRLLGGGGGASRRPGRLSRQVIELVGFVPLNSRQQLQLVRLGSKLVLVAVSINGAEPLAEITDPVEVDQILAACHSGPSALASAIGQWTGRGSHARREFGRGGERRSARALYEA